MADAPKFSIGLCSCGLPLHCGVRAGWIGEEVLGSPYCAAGKAQVSQAVLWGQAKTAAELPAQTFTNGTYPCQKPWWGACTGRDINEAQGCTRALGEPRTPFSHCHPAAAKRITSSLMAMFQVSCLSPFLPQGDKVHALTDSSSPHFPISSALKFCSSSLTKGGCTPPASSATPVGPAVAKRLSERERERDPTHSISPTNPNIPPIATLQPY